MMNTQSSAKMLTPRHLQDKRHDARQHEVMKHRTHLFVGMPGYAGYIRGFNSGPHFQHFSGRYHANDPLMPGDSFKNTPRKHTDIPYGAPNDLYAQNASPRIKTNVKNHSDIFFGDERDRYWSTSYTVDTHAVESQMAPTHQPEPIVDGWLDMEPEERKEQYDMAMGFVGNDGVRHLERSVRVKVEQRSAGGGFVLRKAFKLFDRDGSGDIDPDEFKAAMIAFGLTFTDRQVMALFGTYDDDLSGSLDYYEFLDKVMEADYKTKDGEQAGSVRPKTPPRREFPEQVDLYRQMLRLKEMYQHVDEDAQNTVGPIEVRDFLMECGHKEPDEDDILTVLEALDREHNGTITFTELWDWFLGTKFIQELGDSPQMKVHPEILEENWHLHRGRSHNPTDHVSRLHTETDGNVTDRQELMGRSPRDILKNFKNSHTNSEPPLIPTPPRFEKMQSSAYSPRAGMPQIGNPNSARMFTCRPMTNNPPASLAITKKAYQSRALTGRNIASPRLPPRMQPAGFNPSNSLRPSTCVSGYRV